MQASSRLKWTLKFLSTLLLGGLWCQSQIYNAWAHTEMDAWRSVSRNHTLYAPFAQTTPTPENEVVTSESGGTTSINNFLVLWGPPILVSLAGMFGGLLYGIKEHKLKLPYRKGNTIYPGFLTDILFGAAGGLIIYMIMPGSFQFEAGGFELVKIIAVAMVGGYGGRALVERVLAEQLKQFESQLQQLEDTQQADAVLIALINRHLDDDPDTAIVDKDQLRQAILAASDAARENAFDKARTYRKKVTSERKYELLDTVVPIFEALAASDTEENEARFHAQLGFALNDRQRSAHPLARNQQLDMYRRAKAEMDKAIQIRDRLKQEQKWVYEFARAMSNIGLDANPQEIKEDLQKACQDKSIAERVTKPKPPLGEPLIKWLRARQAELKEWIEEMQILLPDEDDQ